MRSDNENESFEDAIRADIRREILASTSHRNRYAEQIAQIHKEEEERKRLTRGRRRTEITEEELIPEKKAERAATAKERRAVSFADDTAERVDHTRYKKQMEKKRRRESEAQTIEKEMERNRFQKGYLAFVAMLVAVSGLFLVYVWRSIKLYEATRPEYLIEQEIQNIQAGKSVDHIVFPEMEVNPFSNIEAIKDGYIEMLQKADLQYRLARENYQTGDKEYLLLQQEEPVARITLQAMRSEKRLGMLTITQMQVQRLEPVMNILTWDYDIETLDTYHVFINGTEVPASYRQGADMDVPQLQYLYEYVDLPRIVRYHVDDIYKEAEIQITNAQGEDVEYQIEGNKIVATMESVRQNTALPTEIAAEIDPLEAAKTWSLFTTRDLRGANYGLEQVRSYFMKDSYYWQKLGEYARGIDITLVSDHNADTTFFTQEQVSEYCIWGEDCFSCRVTFYKHMKLNTGKEQIDKTDSIFYFVRVRDEKGNASWKIADIQAVVNQ